MSTETQIEKLTAAGFGAKQGREADRVLVFYRGAYIGYLTEHDDGTTGTCKAISKRAGSVAAALRS